MRIILNILVRIVLAVMIVAIHNVGGRCKEILREGYDDRFFMTYILVVVRALEVGAIISFIWIEL